ncbi:PhoH family protein [Eubacterium nodatum ATCC 33099]|nr:PhoH family protein [Eubacterium nodatum ATCC 33099]
MREQEFVKIPIDEEIDINLLFGNLDCNLDRIKEATGVDVFQREGYLLIKGENAEGAKEILQEFVSILKKGQSLEEHKAEYIISLKQDGISYEKENVDSDIICFTTRGKPIKAKTLGQKKYINSMREKDVVFSIGPAGTGKTYLAVAMAITAYRNKEVQKIILARPAVEAGENLGFLPGDLQEKVDPYLRPLYDGLFDILGKEAATRLKEKDIIEVVPLAYMRGRTLDEAFIILDEAQNTTQEQMKMFLTRMGFGSKVVVTGDVTQVDLPKGKKSGLIEASRILKNVKGVDFCRLNDLDVVRHEMVKRIIKAYDNYYKRR